jgi:hypothetical protein
MPVAANPAAAAIRSRGTVSADLGTLAVLLVEIARVIVDDR